MAGASFAELGLSPALCTPLGELGYRAPTAIQEAAIPLVLAGKDLLAGAQTGSGKTAAFALPLLQRLSESEAQPGKGNGLRALVLAPTRELAQQLGQAFKTYGRALPRPLKILSVYGGPSINPQMLALRGGADVLVATPGRLLDLVEQNAVVLSRVEALVLDEADKLLNLGFSEELAKVFALLPKRRQSLLFSATFPEAVQVLAENLLHQAERIEVAAEDKPVISQRVFTVDKERKNALLIHLLKNEAWSRVLVFASAKHTCNRLIEKLAKAKIRAAALHSDLSQGARDTALREFKSGKLRILIATDVAARGIDIESLPCVINFELPRSPNDYIHRIGRTGRAGQAGTALALICPEEYAHFAVIEKRMKQRLERESVAGFEVKEAQADR
ncbi:MAG: DEAD/DEAH box helicase [Gammaproteobacteria bacterium]|nr:DEAD/DEAH box helicase [Gammaproteobacteria bacterium]